MGRCSQVLFLALSLLAAPSLGLGSSQSQRFQQAVDLMETKGDYPAAIRLFEEVAAGDDRRLAARALLYLGLCQEKLNPSRAENLYRQVLQRFSDQSEVAREARSRLAALSRKRARAPSAVLARQVWAGPDVDTQGAPSPDGRYLPYVVWETGDLALRDLVTGTSRRLTGGGSWQTGHALYSIVSPDGKQTAYAWFNGKFYDLRSIGLGGAGPRILFSSEEVPYIYPQEWSADLRRRAQPDPLGAR
jgi:tetratricopeptide (TPR) repeat protein